MNKFVLSHGALVALSVSLIAPASQNACAAGAAEVAPSTIATRLPINLAQGGIGTRLQVREPVSKTKEKSSPQENNSAQALISDDAALTYPLKPGQTSVILALSKIQVLSHINFINFGASGHFTVSVSSTKLGFDGTGWRAAGSGGVYSSPEVVTCELGSAEGRYVKIDFNTDQAGRISGLGVFGTPMISSFQQKPLDFSTGSGSSGTSGFSQGEARDVYFDLANLATGARVVALSRGGDLDQAQAMIDGNVESSYTFDPTDPAPAVVVDLGTRRVLNRLSCVYEAPAGRLDFYLVDNPYPKQEKRSANLNYVGAPSVEPVSNESGEYSGHTGDSGRQAIYSVDTTMQPGLNRLAADLSGQKGRFLVAEFHPINTAAPAPKGDFKDFKDTGNYKDAGTYKDQPYKDVAGTPAAAQPLRVLSLSAFGQSPGDQVVPQLPPPGNPGSGGGNNVPPPPQTPILPPGQPVRVVTP